MINNGNIGEIGKVRNIFLKGNRGNTNNNRVYKK